MDARVPSEEQWHSQPFRRSLVRKLEEAIKEKGTNISRNATELESEAFRRSSSKEEYLGHMARLIISGASVVDVSADHDKRCNAPPCSKDTSNSPANFQDLQNTFVDNMNEASALAMKTVVESQIPLVSCRYSKQNLLNAVKNCRKIQKVESKLLALTVLTDQVVAGIVSHIVDIFQQTFSKGKKKVLDQLGRVWSDTFQEVNYLNRISSPSKPPKNVIVKVHSFIRRQKAALQQLEDKALCQSFILKLSPQANQCFWIYSLDSIDGRNTVEVKNSSFVLKSSSSQTFVYKAAPLPPVPVSAVPRVTTSTSTSNQNISQIPATAAAPPSSTPPPPPPPSSPPSPSPPPNMPEPETAVPQNTSSAAENESVVLAVRKVMVSSYGFANDGRTIAKCQVYSDGKVDINIHASHTSLQMEDFNHVILSPDPEKPLLFLYLTARGCNKVLNLLQGVPGILCSPFSRGGQHNRRIVVCMLSISPHQDNFLSAAYTDSLGSRFIATSSTYGQLLLLKAIDLSKVFNPRKYNPENQRNRDMVEYILEGVVKVVVATSHRRSVEGLVTSIIGELLGNIKSDLVASSDTETDEEANGEGQTPAVFNNNNINNNEDIKANNNAQAEPEVKDFAHIFLTRVKKRKVSEDNQDDGLIVKKGKNEEEVKINRPSKKNNSSLFIDLTQDSPKKKNI